MQKLLSTRGGTIALGGFAAVLAAVVLVVYLNRYRDNVNSSDAPVSVLVAKSLIPTGTSGSVIAEKDLFETTTTPKIQVKDGAITDPSTLKGRVAVTDVYPGQQLTVADFSTDALAALGTQIADDQRVISIPIDAAHGLIGQVQTGDHVDVMAGFNVVKVDENGVPVEGGQARPVIKTIMQDILVISAPGGIDDSSVVRASNRGDTLELRVTNEQSAQLAFASDNGRVWFILRPRSGAPSVTPDFVTPETLILGVKPIVAYESFFAAKPGE